MYCIGRSEIRVYISSLNPSPVIHFQRLLGQLTRAQALITLLVFLSPIEGPSAGDWGAPNTCGPHTFPVLLRGLQGSPRAGHACRELEPELPNPHRGHEGPAGSRRPRPATGTPCPAPRDTASPARAAPGSGAPTRLHRPLSGGRVRGETPPRPRPRRSRQGRAAPRPPGRAAPRAPLGRLPRRHRPRPRLGPGPTRGPRPPGQSARPGRSAASPAAGGSPPLRRPRPRGRRDARARPGPPGPAPGPPRGSRSWQSHRPPKPAGLHQTPRPRPPTSWKQARQAPSRQWRRRRGAGRERGSAPRAPCPPGPRLRRPH